MDEPEKGTRLDEGKVATASLPLRLASDPEATPQAEYARPARSWWAAQWLRALTSWVTPERLALGRTHARRGHVVQLDVQVGRIVGAVQGARPRPYRVRIEMRTFTDEEWDRVVDVMASQAIYAAQLLNGEMPHEVEDVFRAAGVALFPATADDLLSECSCGAWSDVCRHRVAVTSLVGERLDRDPFLLFTLRGRTKDQVLAALRARRAARAQTSDPSTAAAQALSQAGIALTSDPSCFWRPGPELDRVGIHVRPPEVEMEIVRLLGDPVFVDDPAAVEELAEVYRRVTRRALVLAFDESDVEG